MPDPNTTNAASPARRKLPTPPGWCRAADLVAEGIVSSEAWLERALKRLPGDNPFPRPARDPANWHRFWKREAALAWREREVQRFAARLQQTDTAA